MVFVTRAFAARLCYGPRRMRRLLALTTLALLSCAKPDTSPPDGGGAGGGAGPAVDAPLPDTDPAAIAVKAADPATADALRTALAGTHRGENPARDRYRHPYEMLLFFGLRQDMTVVELWPGGGGWFTEVLAPVLREKGKLIATNFDTSGPPDSYQARGGKKFLEKLAGNPALYDKVEVVTVKDPATLSLAADGTVDMVVTFRNTHGWVEDGIDDKIYTAAFKALKSGGVLGVEQHRARADAAGEPKEIAKTGYLPEAWVISRIEAFGFKLAAKSEVNANPRDTKDYAKGVWTLPPSFELGETDKAKYAAIGESDRMTLKFVKP